MSRHATIIDANTGWCYTDWEPPRPLPQDWAAGGLGALLRRVAVRTGIGEGVLLLDGIAAKTFGLPDAAPGDAGDPTAAAIVDALQALGWSTAVDWLRSWTRFTAPGLPAMHLGILPWMPSGRFGLAVMDGDVLAKQSTADALGLWHDLTGCAYTMSPGVAAVNVLRAGMSGRTKVVWKCEPRPVGAFEERQLCEDWWRGPARGSGESVFFYDARRAGLAAAINAEVSPYPLRPTGRRAFDPTLAGWWQCEIPPWNLDDRMPHPAGPGDKTVRWLSSPTVVLLHQLAGEGVMSAPLIVDSYTGPGRRLFRNWGQRMDTAWRFANELTTEPGPTVADAIKRGAAREAHGMMGSDRGAVRREDWYHTVTAVKRANVWRRGWSVGRKHGVWPVGIDDDNLIYDRPVDDAFPIGTRLGQYRTKTEVL